MPFVLPGTFFLRLSFLCVSVAKSVKVDEHSAPCEENLPKEEEIATISGHQTIGCDLSRVIKEDCKPTKLTLKKLSQGSIINWFVVDEVGHR